MIIENLIVMSYQDSHYETVWFVLAVVGNDLKFVDSSETEEGAHKIIDALQEKAGSLISDELKTSYNIKDLRLKSKGH